MKSLRPRLSALLFNHIKKELPSLKAELTEKYQRTKDKIDVLGMKRTTPLQQRAFLMKLCSDFSRLSIAGSEGQWIDDFFGRSDADVMIEDLAARRLRARVYKLNVAFAEKMRTAHTFEDSFIGSIRRFPDDRSPQNLAIRAGAMNIVAEFFGINQTGGLPGTPSPFLVGELFRTQTKRWESIAQCYIDAVSNACTVFVQKVLKHICADHVAAAITSTVVLPAVQKRKEDAELELKKLIKDTKREPTTYNFDYSDMFKQLEAIELLREKQANSPNPPKEIPGPSTPRPEEPFRPSSLEKRRNETEPSVSKKPRTEKVIKRIDPNERHSCGQALKSLLAYYDVGPTPFFCRRS